MEKLISKVTLGHLTSGQLQLYLSILRFFFFFFKRRYFIAHLKWGCAHSIMCIFHSQVSDLDP